MEDGRQVGAEIFAVVEKSIKSQSHDLGGMFCYAHSGSRAQWANNAIGKMYILIGWKGQF